MSRAAVRRLAAATGAAVGAVVLAHAAGSTGQTVDVQHPLTLVAGTPAGGARTDRIDSLRSGRSRDPLPAGGLASTWHVGVGAFLEHAPVVDAHGTAYAVGSRGEVVAVARDGGERWRTSTGAAQASAPVLSSDDTLVFVDATGIAVAVREGSVRWRTRFGRSDASRPAPLALDDGGVVVATAHDLAALDAEGHVRSHTALPEAASAPLVAALGKVIVVTVTGAVWSWCGATGCAVEPTRLGSFGAPVEGGAALADDHTLLAITSGGVHLAAMDLARGTVATRAVAPAGVWLGPPSVHAGTAYLQLLGPTADVAIALDASGVETARILLGMHPPPAAADGGAATLAPVPHTPPLVDAAGTLVFATTDGSIGAVRTGGASRVDLVASICPPSTDHAEPAVAGMAPLGPSAIVVACRAGALVALQGGEGPSPHL